MEFPFLLKNGLTCIGELPSHDDPNSINYQATGCKKFENVNRFYSTTAGTLMIVRPCGIILNVSEMYKCESCTQVWNEYIQSLLIARPPFYYFKHSNSGKRDWSMLATIDHVTFIQCYWNCHGEKNGPSFWSMMCYTSWIHFIVTSTRKRPVIQTLQMSNTICRLRNSQKLRESTLKSASRHSDGGTGLSLSFQTWQC